LVEGREIWAAAAAHAERGYALPRGPTSRGQEPPPPVGST